MFDDMYALRSTFYTKYLFFALPSKTKDVTKVLAIDFTLFHFSLFTITVIECVQDAKVNHLNNFWEKVLCHMAVLNWFALSTAIETSKEPDSGVWVPEIKVGPCTATGGLIPPSVLELKRYLL